MERDFNEWLNGFRASIANYKYYVDFDKVYANVEDIKIELNILNSLIGESNIAEKFKKLVACYPEILKCVPIILAKREKEILVADGQKSFCFNFEKMNYKIEDYVKFMTETGLFGLLQDKMINNLVDYVTGVEVGLDSNARKNRGGHLMEDLVESYISKAGFIRNVNYFKEMYLTEVEERWGLDLSSLSNNGQTEKRFDFVIKTSSTVYAIETNFYTSSGSKLNETSRSYKELAQEAESISGFKFMWITDGTGWQSARNNLKETFEVLTTLYNIKDMENGIFEHLR